MGLQAQPPPKKNKRLPFSIRESFVEKQGKVISESFRVLPESPNSWAKPVNGWTQNNEVQPKY